MRAGVTQRHRIGVGNMQAACGDEPAECGAIRRPPDARPGVFVAGADKDPWNSRNMIVPPHRPFRVRRPTGEQFTLRIVLTVVTLGICATLALS
jgi:hypothetical protein